MVRGPAAAAGHRAGVTAPPLPRLGPVGAVVVLGSVMVVLDVTIANVALDRLAAGLDAGLAQVQWVSSGYTLALAAVMPASRWAMDRVGCRTVFLGSLVAFTLGSALAAAAGDIGWLVGFRVLQGLGGGMLAPTAMTLVFRTAGPHRLPTATRILGAPLLVAPLLGPVLGGLLVDAVSWRALFAINVPIGVAAIALTLALLPRDRPDDPGAHPLDVPALLMLSPGVTLLVLGPARAAEHGPDTLAMGCALAGAALIAGFAVRTLASPRPLLDLRLLRRRSVGAAVAAGSLFACGYFGSMFLAPLYLQLVRGTSVAVSGLLVAPLGICAAVTMQLAAGAVARVGAARVVRVGVPTALAGLVAFAVQLRPDAPYPGLCLALAVMGVGVGATLMPAITAANTGLDPADSPAVNTVFQVSSQLAAATGTALVAVVLSTALAAALTVPTGDALAAARALPPELLPDVAGAFRAAYLVGAVLFVLAGAAALALPRHRTTG